CESNVEQSPTRRQRRFHFDERPERSWNQKRWLKDKERQERLDAIKATKKIMARLVCRQNREQRTRKDQALSEEIRMRKRIRQQLPHRGDVISRNHQQNSDQAGAATGFRPPVDIRSCHHDSAYRRRSGGY